MGSSDVCRYVFKTRIELEHVSLTADDMNPGGQKLEPQSRF